MRIIYGTESATGIGIPKEIADEAMNATAEAAKAADEVVKAADEAMRATDEAVEAAGEAVREIVNEAVEATKCVQIDRDTIVGLGNFDGLHIGHMALIQTVVSEGKISGLDSMVYTFEKHPENIMRMDLLTPLLMTNQHKLDMLKKTGLDIVYLEMFTEEYSRMSPECFIKHVLVKKLCAKHIVVGYDYRFGYMAKGSVEDLKRLQASCGYKLTVIPPIRSGCSVVSSTLIREQIRNGKFEDVFFLLGRHFSITGTVQPGKRIGKGLGVPTANVYPEKHLLLPPNGVYVTVTLLRDRLFRSVTNVGINPTISADNVRVMETHLLDFDENIYDAYIEVFFLKKLREEQMFADVDALTQQLQKDIAAAHLYFKKGKEIT